MAPPLTAFSHFASNSCWFAVEQAMNWENISFGNVSVSPVGFTEAGKNCKMSEWLMQLGGEEVKFARKLLSPKNVYLRTATCDEVLLL